MNNNPFAGIKVLLAEPKSNVRKEFLGVLKELGCKNIMETGNIKDVHEALEEGGVDLLIGDTTLPEGDLSEVIYKIRHSQIGDNPFAIAMILVSKSDKDLISKVIDSGADDILIKPIDSKQLRDRLLMFSLGRKPFIVTSDYIGPDRRSKAREEKSALPSIVAPNPLFIRLSGTRGSGVMKKAVTRAMSIVNEKKVERHAYSVHWLMERIIEVQNGDIFARDFDMEEQFQRLNEVAVDISNRLNGTTYHHAAEMCMTLENMTAILKETPDLAGEDEMFLLGKLTEVIKRKCNGSCGDEEAPQIDAPEISPDLAAE